MGDEVGELGLPYTEYGMVVQSLARVLVDRGIPLDYVIHQLRDTFDEALWWEQIGGPLVDRLAEDWLDLPPFPKED
jgi:hypothetical protein